MIRTTVPHEGAANVLFLVEVINCNDGIASYCETLASGLKNRGVRVYLASGQIRSDEKSEAKRRKLNAAVGKWYEFPGIGKIPSLSRLVQLVKIIRENNITVINVHGLGMLFWGRLLSLMTGARFIGTYHPSILGSIDQVKKSSDAKFSLKQVIFLNIFFPKYLIVLSQESVQYITQHRIIGKNRVVKIYGGTDLGHFYPPTPADRQRVRDKYDLSDDDFVCLLAARLAWVKGHDLLIKAARKIRDSREGSPLKIKCFFVGSGGADREQEIRSFAYAGDARDNDTFKFLGFMGDVRDALWAADVFVSPSRFEGFCIGVVEAMATGLVPVRTPSGGAFDQIIDGKTGFIVPFEDVDALCEAIEKLTNATARQAMSGNCIARAQEVFGVEPMVDQMLSVYGLSTAPADIAHQKLATASQF